MKLVTSLLAGALVVVAGGVARAQMPPAQSPSLAEMQELAQQHLQLQEPQMLARPAPPPAPAFWQGQLPPDRELPRLESRTALMPGRNTLELGVLAFAYTITDWLQVGVDPPFWALRAVTSVLVPNGHIKVAPVRRSGLWVAGNVGFYYAALSSSAQATGQLYVVPLSAFVSVKPLPRFWVHGEGTYIWAHLNGTGDYKRVTIGGTGTTQAAQVGLMAQYQLTRVVSVTLWGRYEPYTKDITVQGSGPVGDSGFATVQGRIAPAFNHPWAVVPGVACLWTHVRFTVGAGYGTFFLPGMDLPVRGPGFVPDASFYVVL